jgi:hypothetical protein
VITVVVNGERKSKVLLICLGLETRNVCGWDAIARVKFTRISRPADIEIAAAAIKT